MCKHVPSLCPCGVTRAPPFLSSPLYTLYIFISHWRCGCSCSACAPAAPHSPLGLMLVQNSSQSPSGTPRHGSPCVLPIPSPPALCRWLTAHGKAATPWGKSWQCHTKLWLLLFPLQGLSSCYNFLCFFSTSFPADPFFVSVSLKCPGYSLVLLVAIFRFKWPAWDKHLPDSSVYSIHMQCHSLIFAGIAIQATRQ